MAGPEVQTLEPSEITTSSMKLHGLLKSHGGIPTKCNFIWWDNYPVGFHSEEEQLFYSSPKDFYTTIYKVAPYKAVYYRAIALNLDGLAQGDTLHAWWLTPGQPEQGLPWLPISYTQWWNGMTLVWILTTDIHCHLFLRYGGRKPWKKAGTHEKRGRVFYHAPTVGFPYTTQISQIEPGDTLQHTFHIPFTFYCQWKYWYCLGLVDDKDSPSITAFYKAHCQKPTYIPACYSDDAKSWAYVADTFIEWGPRLLPATTFTATHLIIYLGRHIDEDPPKYAVFHIWKTDDNWKPIGAPLTEITIPISVPLPDTWYKHEGWMAPLTMHEGTKYQLATHGWPLTLEPPHYRYKVAGGKKGVCNFYPYEEGYWRYYSSIGWGLWYPGDIAPFYYQLESTG